MTEKDRQFNELRLALARLLRATANPDPLHPSWRQARDFATTVYQETAKNDTSPD